MTYSNIPADPNQIKPEWLTNVLRSGNVISEACLTSFRKEEFVESIGFVGEVVKFNLNYDIQENGAPSSLVAKFPSSDPDTRRNLNQSGTYEREVKFYREIANKSPIKIPRLYYGASDPVSNNHILLLEDINYARRGDVITGCTFEEASLAVEKLAVFQAFWWETPILDKLDWLQSLTKDADEVQESFEKLWTLCINKLKGKIPRSFQDLVKKSSNHVADIRVALGNPPRTITHGDYRLDNMFFGEVESESSLIVIDWQFATIGRGVGDVAWFMMYCMPTKQRRSTEMDILSIYHLTLEEYGVQGYTLEQCILDYRLSMLQLIQRIVPAGAYLDFRSKRGNAIISQVFERTSAALYDLKVEELLPVKHKSIST